MSSRPFLVPFTVVSAGDMSGDLTSSVSIIQQISFVSYSLVWTGTPTGSFQVQVSNDYSNGTNGPVNAGTWTTLTLSASTSTGGAAGSGFIDIDGVAAYAIRLAYTAVSGSGSLTAKVCGKAA